MHREFSFYSPGPLLVDRCLDWVRVPPGARDSRPDLSIVRKARFSPKVNLKVALCFCRAASYIRFQYLMRRSEHVSDDFPILHGITSIFITG